MNKFIQTNDIYIIDDSIIGFLTLVHTTYKNKRLPEKIYDELNYKDNIFDSPVYIKEDINKALYMKKLIITKLNENIFNEISLAILSNNKEKYNIIYDFLYNAFIHGTKINYLRTIKSVTDLQKLIKNITRESHRFKGFIRFSKTSENVFFAKIKPDNNILFLVANHFKNRLKNEKWCIIDEKRNIGAFYYNNKLQIINNLEISSVNISKSKEEETYEKLWKQFYKSVNIKERKNTKCMMNFMPKKYWENILEVKNE